MKEIEIDEKYDGIRFDKYLKKILINVNDNFIYKMLRKKNILLNDKPSKGIEKLKIGDKIVFFFKDETFQKFTIKTDNKNFNIDDDLKELFKNSIVYEDNNLLIIDKWDGIKSQNDDKDSISINTLFVDYMKNDIEDTLYNKSIINRLDTNTKGLMICAKNYKAARTLTKLIEDKYIKKYYKFIINGHLKEKQKRLILYFKKDNNNAILTNKKIDGYKLIETDYKVLKEYDNYSIVEAELLTGKFHQIRASFAYIGNPLVLDKKYEKNDLYLDNKKHFKQDTQILISYKLLFENIEDENFSYLNNKMFYSKYNVEDYIKT